MSDTFTDPPRERFSSEPPTGRYGPPSLSDSTFRVLGFSKGRGLLAGRPIPFQIVAPALVVFLGALALLSMTGLGLGEIDAIERKGAEQRGLVLGSALLARLETASDRQTEKLLGHAARTSDTTLVLLDRRGSVAHASPTQPLSENDLAVVRRAERPLLLPSRPGEVVAFADAANGRRLVALVPLRDTSGARAALIASLFAFAIILLSAAGLVAWALARDVHADVLYLRGLIVSMASDKDEPHRSLIPVRTIDQVGQLTASFNVLLERFFAAERVYRQDLAEVNAFSKDRSEFLAALSHELRTPLNVILGFADVLLSEIDGPLSEEARENLTIVRTSGEHLRSLIDDILTLSALESGEFRLSKEQLDLHQVASDVVTEARVTAVGKGLFLTLEPKRGDTTLAADRRRMRQVLGNVIGNAVKFTSSGSIVVEARGDEHEVTVTVSDTGPGIEKASLERIFEEFEQSSAGTRQRTGTGLGLSITRRLVHLHGGTVRAESVLGEGSTFTIRLPRVPANVPPGVVPPSPIVVRDKHPESS